MTPNNSSAHVVDPAVSQPAQLKPPYPPSWFDRFKAWVERLPTPYWLFYLLVGIVLFALISVIEWQVGALPVGTFNAFQAWLAFEIPFVVAMMHYLDHSSARALTTIHPSLAVAESDYAALEYQLTHLPAWRTLISGLLGGGVGLAVLYLGILSGGTQLEQGAQINYQPLSIAYISFNFILTWVVYGVFILHTFRQLRLIRRIYDEYAQVNLYELGPLYAFSGITGRTAIVFVFLNVMWNVTAPYLAGFAVTIVTGLFFVAIGLASFLVPLLGIHNRIVREKERHIIQNSQRIQATVIDLYQQVDSLEFQRTTALKDSLTALDIHAKMLEKIPTWPWEPGTARTVITAILFPVIVFTLQFVLQRFLK